MEEDRILHTFDMDPENILERRLNDHDDLCILEFDMKLLTVCLIQSVAVMEQKLDISKPPEELKPQVHIMTGAQ